MRIQTLTYPSPLTEAAEVTATIAHELPPALHSGGVTIPPNGSNRANRGHNNSTTNFGGQARRWCGDLREVLDAVCAVEGPKLITKRNDVAVPLNEGSQTGRSIIRPRDVLDEILAVREGHHRNLRLKEQAKWLADGHAEE